jgi:hypothetical protein
MRSKVWLIPYVLLCAGIIVDAMLLRHRIRGPISQSERIQLLAAENLMHPRTLPNAVPAAWLAKQALRKPSARTPNHRLSTRRGSEPSEQTKGRHMGNHARRGITPGPPRDWNEVRRRARAFPPGSSSESK